MARRRRQSLERRLLKMLGFGSPAMVIAAILSYFGIDAPLKLLQMTGGPTAAPRVQLPRQETPPEAVQPAVIRRGEQPPTIERTAHRPIFPAHREPKPAKAESRPNHKIANLPIIDWLPR